MGDRAGRAARREARLENRANVDVGIRSEVDGGESVSGSSDGDVVEEVVSVHRGRAQPPRAVPPLAMDPRMWLNMVNVKPPYLFDLEVERMKKIILEYKRYAQKCPCQCPSVNAAIRVGRALGNYVQRSWRRNGGVHGLGTSEFISAMLRMHAANSSRKWR